MKQKVVLRVHMVDAKKRAKAMKVAAGLTGVVSAAIEGAEKNHIVVIGEGVDPITLTTLLRKHMGQAELISVLAIEDKKQEEKKEEKKATESTHVVVWPPYYEGGGYTQPYYVADDVRGHYQDPSCTIM